MKDSRLSHVNENNQITKKKNRQYPAGHLAVVTVAVAINSDINTLTIKSSRLLFSTFALFLVGGEGIDGRMGSGGAGFSLFEAHPREFRMCVY